MVRVAVPSTPAGFAALHHSLLVSCVRAVADGADDSPGLQRSFMESAGELRETTGVELRALAARIEAAALTGAVTVAGVGARHKRLVVQTSARELT